MADKPSPEDKSARDAKSRATKSRASKSGGARKSDRASAPQFAYRGERPGVDSTRDKSESSDTPSTNPISEGYGEIEREDASGRDVLLERCEARIGYQFQDRSYLISALTHASGADHRLLSNERMEFLGDAILGFCVCDALYRSFPEFLEGDLTRIKSVVVSRRTCARVSRVLKLADFLFVGKGMTNSPQVPASLYADVFESLIAAIYLDGGLAASREFVERHMLPEIERTVEGENEGNFKSILQQVTQKDHGAPPVYLLVDEQGPDHSKSFLVAAEVGKRRFTPAWGRNKKEAEQRAAGNALAEMEGELPPYPNEE